MKWTLNQAYHETGVAKATILRAITGRRMSAEKNELGNYEIDPSEFYRVFPPKTATSADVPGTKSHAEQNGPPSGTGETTNETGWLEAELKRLAELLKMTNLERERDREKADSEIRFLRSRIEHGDQERQELAEERRKLTAQLLTYQRPPDPPAPSSAPARRGLLGLFRKAG